MRRDIQKSTFQGRYYGDSQTNKQREKKETWSWIISLLHLAELWKTFVWTAATEEAGLVLNININMKQILHVRGALIAICYAKSEEWVSVPHRAALTLIPKG